MKNPLKLRKSDFLVLISVLVIPLFMYFFEGIILSSAVNLKDWMINFGYAYGYFGAFIISIFGNFTIIFPVPYALTIFALGSLGLNPLLLALFSALGASIGEFSAYFIGRGISELKLEEKYGQRFDKIKKFIGRYGILAIVVFAATPLPDDIILIPLGMIQYSLFTVLGAAFLGKFILCILLSYGGKLSWSWVSVYLSSGNFLGAIFTVASIILFSYFVVRLDWINLMEEYQKTLDKMKGLKEEI